MRFFFFGTLMDLDILSTVIGRQVSPDVVKPAHLTGFRRVAAQGKTYPIIVPDEDDVVEGVMVAGISPQEREQLEAYEGENYRVVTSLVDARAQRREVLMFEPVDGAFKPSDTPWDFVHWQRQEKARFLENVRRWKKADPVELN